MTPYIYAGLPDKTQRTYLNRSKEVIIEIVIKSLKTSREELLKKTHLSFNTKARAIAAYFLKKETQLSLKEIGQMIGGKDHSTVRHLISNVEDRSYNPKMQTMFNKVEKGINDYKTQNK